MPWKASSVVDERTRFVLEHERGLYTMTDLCEIYDIARETGYYWLRRDQQGGLAALRDRDRGAARHPKRTAARSQRAGVTLAPTPTPCGPPPPQTLLEHA